MGMDCESAGNAMDMDATEEGREGKRKTMLIREKRKFKLTVMERRKKIT
jgi:hypothetical protein